MDFKVISEKIENLIAIKDLETARHLIDKTLDGKTLSAQHITEEVKIENSRARFLQRWELLLFKSTIYDLIGKFFKAVTIADQLLEEITLYGESPASEKQNMIQLRAKIAKIIPLCLLWNINECLQVIEQIDKQIKEMKITYSSEIRSFDGVIQLAKGWCNLVRGDFSVAHSFLESSLDILKGSDKHDRYIGMVLNKLGFLYSEEGDYINGEKFFQRALAFNEEKDYPLLVVLTLTRFANLYCEKGDFINAVTHARRAVTLGKNCSPSGGSILAEALGSLGKLYYHKGELNRALENLEESVEVYKRIPTIMYA